MISRMRAGSNRNSSAAAWVISAREPCPASTLPVMTVIDAVAIDVQSCGDAGGAAPAESSAASPTPAALGQGDLAGDGDQQPGAEHLHEVAP